MVRFQNSDRIALVLMAVGGALAALGTPAGQGWVIAGVVLMLSGAALFLFEGFKKGRSKRP